MAKASRKPGAKRQNKEEDLTEEKVTPTHFRSPWQIGPDAEQTAESALGKKTEEQDADANREEPTQSPRHFNRKNAKGEPPKAV